MSTCVIKYSSSFLISKLLLITVLILYTILVEGGESSGKKVSVSEVSFDSTVDDIQWCGSDHRTVILKTTKGKVYRSKDGGRKWTEITESLDNELQKENLPVGVTVDSILVNQFNKNVVVIIGTKKYHFISEDAGNSFRRLMLKANVHSWTFHPTNSNYALFSTWSDDCYQASSGNCSHKLYVTRDIGHTFNEVVNYVVQYSWGDKTLNLQDRIYFTHHRSKTGDQPRFGGWSQYVDFAYTENFGNSSHLLLHQGNKFLVSNGYIFVAKLAEVSKQTVKLFVSTDGGMSFQQAQLPVEVDEKSYTVLDTSEGTIMIHVNHGEKSNVGNVYVSDAAGVRYSLSLPNNVRTVTGECEFDKILSLEGVYIANFKDFLEISTNDLTVQNNFKNDDDISVTEIDKKRGQKSKAKSEDVVRTVITFDKGGVWSYLQAPKVDSRGMKIDCPTDRCFLHLHGITNFHQYAPFYSVENAVGIIIATGNVGSHLRFEPDEVNTYMSRDGGITWIEAHKGAFVYEFGDHGGLTVMADDIVKTNQVVFSWNEGQSWYDFEISSHPVEVDNIVIEPNSSSVEFLLYGTMDDVGVLYHLDFSSLGQPKCNGVWAADSVSSDYEHWTPSDGRTGDNCILGKSITFTRRKQTSECFNGPEFVRPVLKKICQCTTSDYECELGFARKVGSYECKPVDPTLTAVGCTTSSYFYADAYRKVPGDVCERGWIPTRVAVPCPKHAPFSRGAKAVLVVILLIAAIMFAITYLSRSPRLKHLFKNYGFESFASVGYNILGGKQPDSAVDMCYKYEPELGFIDSEQEEQEEDAPTLMTFSESNRYYSSEKKCDFAGDIMDLEDRTNPTELEVRLQRKIGGNNKDREAMNKAGKQG